jgi:hypothetical protein
LIYPTIFCPHSAGETACPFARGFDEIPKNMTRATRAMARMTVATIHGFIVPELTVGSLVSLSSFFMFFSLSNYLLFAG